MLALTRHTVAVPVRLSDTFPLSLTAATWCRFRPCLSERGSAVVCPVLVATLREWGEQWRQHSFLQPMGRGERYVSYERLIEEPANASAVMWYVIYHICTCAFIDRAEAFSTPHILIAALCSQATTRMQQTRFSLLCIFFIVGVTNLTIIRVLRTTNR